MPNASDVLRDSKVINYNFAGQTVGQGAAASTTEAVFLVPNPFGFKPSNISVSGLFKIVNATAASSVATGLSVTINSSTASANCLRVSISGLTGLTANEPLLLLSDGSASLVFSF